MTRRCLQPRVVVFLESSGYIKENICTTQIKATYQREN